MQTLSGNRSDGKQRTVYYARISYRSRLLTADDFTTLNYNRRSAAFVSRQPTRHRRQSSPAERLMDLASQEVAPHCYTSAVCESNSWLPSDQFAALCKNVVVCPRLKKAITWCVLLQLVSTDLQRKRFCRNSLNSYYMISFIHHKW